MGIISPPDHIQPDNHMGFALNDSGPYNIYAPGDGTITMIFWTKRDWDPSSGKTGQYDDYDMEITCSSTFIVRFSHMAGIANSVLAKSGKLIFNQSTKVKIPVKAGDIVGTALKRLPQKCLDLWAMDSNVTVPFVRPDHHTASMNAVCPLDYFEDSVKTILLNKDPRTVEPRGGTATYDKAGTLAGGWYLLGTKYDEKDQEYSLCFGYDATNPEIINLGIGRSFPIGAGLFCFSGNAPDPATITKDSGTVVLKLTGRWDTKIIDTMVVQITGDESIKIEAFPGDVANPQFTDKALTYVR